MMVKIHYISERKGCKNSQVKATIILSKNITYNIKHEYSLPKENLPMLESEKIRASI